MAPFSLAKPALAALLLFSVIGLDPVARAEDWPVYMGDNHRSGITSMTLETPLGVQWVHVPDQAPRPAWPEPARQDFWNQVRELSPVVVYDRAYHVVSAGDAVYYASSADDQVYCLDAATGEIRWRFFTEGPVRLAPTLAGEYVYFSSDDGHAYCVSADAGTLVWKYSPAEQDRRLPGNGRVISYAPARTGVLVDSGTAWFFSGLFPPAQVFKSALDAGTGRVLHRAHAGDVSPQGYLLATSTRLFVPTGRTAPMMFDRSSLENLGGLEGPGGAYAILVEDALVSGPGVRAVNQLHYTAQETRERVANFPGIRMLVHEGIAYLQGPNEVSALDRETYIELSMKLNQRNAALNDKNRELRDHGHEDPDRAERLAAEIGELLLEIARLEAEQDACYRWKKPAADPYSMILVGDILFLGGQDRVHALRASDGEAVWNYDLDGRIYGLAAARGRLYASSSTGNIYCFSANAPESPAVVERSRNPEPYDHAEQSDSAADMANEILTESGITKGYCLVLGAGDGHLAYELARQSELHVIGVERDASRVNAARRALADTGLYGSRIVIHHVAGEALPYTSYLANLVVTADAPAWSKAEIYRIMRPYGGKAFFQMPQQNRAAFPEVSDTTFLQTTKGPWTIVERGAVPGAGEWTQLYADASHTAYSNDQLRGPVTVQWFGDPGPREMVDRHHRPMSSMFRAGRLFITGDNKIITVDGYNGFPLWELEVPDSRRIGVMKSSGQQLLAGDHLYIVRAGECWAVNAATGNKDFVIEAPAGSGTPRHWGYLNAVDHLLIGSLQAPDANFDRMSKAMVSVLEGDFRPVIISESLFATDRLTGTLQWHYQNGRLLNAMIAVGDDRVYLVESRNQAAMTNTNGRIRINEFLDGEVFLLALDAHTGNIVWERKVALPFEHIAYLCGRDGRLVATGSYNDNDRLYYDLVAFNMSDGTDLWATTFPGMNIRGTDFSPLEGSHGEQWQHPVLAEDTIYLRPYAFSLETGDQLDYIAYRGGHGCGGLTGSAHYLFGRGNVPRMYPRYESSTDGIPLTEVSRPGCFLNIIPAGGIIMVPESSSGCTCAYPLQTSVALIPESAAYSVEHPLNLSQRR